MGLRARKEKVLLGEFQNRSNGSSEPPQTFGSRPEANSNISLLFSGRDRINSSIKEQPVSGRTTLRKRLWAPPA